MARRFWKDGRRFGGVFATLIISYSIILCIPVLGGIRAYNNAIDEYEQLIKKTGVVVLEQIQDAIDRQLMSVKRISDEIALNRDIREILFSEYPFDVPTRMKLVKIVDYLSVLANVNHSTLDDFYIYQQGSDSIINRDGVYRTNLFYRYVMNYGTLDYEEWKAILAEPGNRLHSFQVHTGGNQIRENLILTYSLPAKGVGILVIHLTSDKITRLVEDVEGIEHSNIYMLGGDNAVLMDTGDNVIQPTTVNSIIEHMDQPGYEMNFDDYIVNVVSSDVIKGRYVSIVPQKLLLTKVRGIRNSLIISLAVSLLLGGILAFLFSRWYTKPIKRIVGYMHDEMKQVFDEPEFISLLSTRNEFEIITSRLHHVFTMGRRFRNVITEQIPMMEQAFYSGLLYGKIDENSRRQYEYLHIDFPYPLFTVVCIEVDDAVLSCQFANELLPYMYDEINRSGFFGYVLEEAAGRFVAIINCERDIGEDDGNALRRLVRRLRICMDSFGMEEVTFSVGSVKNGMYQLSAAYREARQALTYKLIHGSGAVIFYEAVRNVKNENYLYPVYAEVKLINAIKAGDMAAARSQLDELFDVNFRRRSLSPDDAIGFHNELTGTIIRVVDEMRSDGQGGFLLPYSPKERLQLSRGTLRDMKETVGCVVHDLCRLIDQNRKSRNQALRERLIRYIQDNYMDEELNGTKIADYLGISTSYLSHFFKEQNGEGLSAFLLRVRMEKAKELMRDEDRKVFEIAKSVGYGNVNTFIRNFKQYAGMTPGQYRENPLPN